VIGWLDGQAGASGDMLLGAVVDAGVPLVVLNRAVDQLGLGIEISVSEVTRGGLGATKVDVQVADSDPTSRSWSQVRTMLDQVDAPETALEVFRRLAEAEAAIHRVPVDEVHFHEVGAHDALADVVGVTAAFAHLGLTGLHCSTLALGSGTTRGSHGPIPVPAPAVLSLLAGKPVEAGPSPHESTTPTGAALLATLVTDWGPLPPMTIERTGMGAGGRDPAELANVLRLVLGEPAVGQVAGPGTVPGDMPARPSSGVLLETNVDDLDPRLWPHVLAQLLGAGASDAWLTPILMKKGRPAHTLSVLCTSTAVGGVREAVFRETSTLGMRELVVVKHALDRTESSVDLDGQRIRVKTALIDGRPVNTNPEWEDVLAAARALGRPAKQVLADAVALLRPR
jgi:uncharacterized protein (TIGR00299 family) protein